ncbi:hypothetical protein [Cryobacterium sp. TMT1-66-1]|uniref:hypothetical protein n=1 Tax=Cryobacterium sp. TMT1-66-1 TaxID=1259242 RepID=UPI00106DC059|nr:hypothetical protein [Cryobacterium sp. TMT1-66-1]TFD04148.1 hypothetical protein E3T29_15960 [Cryobacterium sp. TMT1-66-1]
MAYSTPSAAVELKALKELRTLFQTIRDDAQEDLYPVLVQIGKLEYRIAVEEAAGLTGSRRS